MYLAAANYQGLATVHPPQWYLRRAYRTIVGMYTQASWYAHQGLMDGTNFLTILRALRAEGLRDEATVVESIMRNRTIVGVENQCRYYVPPGLPAGDRGPAYPGCHWYLEQNTSTPWVEQTGLPGAGSEFAWDTTGQEEAYIWGTFFGGDADTPAAKLATSALNQILAYTPLVPNWAWHGSAYGMGDFNNNGYYRGNERVLQHYRSGLNAIPTTEAFLRSPDDTYLLRLAAGSIGGTLANIDESGANSMAFHSDPSNLFYDPASGDGGLGLYGHTHTTAAFLVHDADLGFQCYFCDFLVHTGDGVGGSGSVTLTPRDSYRRAVYLAPLGCLLVSEAGVIANVVSHLKDPSAQGHAHMTSFRVEYAPVKNQPLTSYRLRLDVRAGRCSFAVAGSIPVVRGAFEVPLSAPVVQVTATCP